MDPQVNEKFAALEARINEINKALSDIKVSGDGVNPPVRDA